MAVPVWLAKLFGADMITDTVKSIGKGAGNIMNRIGFTEKMSEMQKAEQYLEVIRVTAESDKLDAEDLKSAREMYMVQMQTQKASWLVRFMNGTLRPTAGWWALICVTDKWWGQALSLFIEGFAWVPITATAEDKIILGGILTFFFGFRQRAKEKQVSINS